MNRVISPLGRKNLTLKINAFRHASYIFLLTAIKGAISRPPHAQDSLEELIIIKEGTLNCTIGDKIATLGAGSVLLILPLEMQTFENTGDGPVT